MKNENQKKLPAMQFYPGDWRKDPGIQALDYETRAIWFEMILIMHESEERGVLLLNGQPMPDEALGRILGLDNQKLTLALTKLLTFGVASRREGDSALFNRRMVRDEEIRQIRAKCGIMGGNPNLLNQKSTTKDNQKSTTKDNHISTPSSSSSSSSSSSDKRERDAKIPLVQIGKVLRMSTEELETCKKDFGEALLTQEVKEADLWLERAQTPNARKYRKPNHNHYLFFRNWLKDKRLKNQPSLNGRKPTTFELNPDIFGDVNL